MHKIIPMLKKEQQHILDNLVEKYPCLDVCKSSIEQAFSLFVETFTNKGKLLIAGNGGSAADSEHIVGELMKSFVVSRKCNELQNDFCRVDYKIGMMLSQKLQGALPAIALDGHPALSTAFSNDCDSMLCFAQQVFGYGNEGDIFLGISTSGNSENIIYAAVTAKAKGLKVVGLTGDNGGKLKKYCDECICVPEKETYKIQELHLPVYHALCMMIECYFFK